MPTERRSSASGTVPARRGGDDAARSATRPRRGWWRASTASVAAATRSAAVGAAGHLDGDDRAEPGVARPGRPPGVPSSRAASSRALAVARSSRTCRVRSPRRASQVSIGPAMAPASSRCRATAGRASSRPASVDAVTSAPRMTSEWPERYLVTECSTTSTPSAERLLHQRSGEGVVAHRQRAGLACHRGQGGQVGHLEHGVGGGLEPEQRRAVEGRRAPLPWSVGSTRRTVDGARSRSSWSSRVATCRCRRAAGRRRRRRGGTSDRAADDRGHARGEDQGVATLEPAEGLLERRPRRVAAARVVDRPVGDVGRGELEGRVDAGTRHTGLAAQGDHAGGGGQVRRGSRRPA